MLQDATQTKLLDISRKMAETRELDPLLRYAMKTALELFGAEFGYLILLNEAGHLYFRVGQDKNGNPVTEPSEQISHTIFEKVIQKREPLIVSDALRDPQLKDAESVLHLRLRSVVCVPLIVRDRVLGAIYLENRSAQAIFKPSTILPLQYFAAQAAVAIENAMLYENLEARVEQRTKDLLQANALLQEEIAARKRAEQELERLAITDSLTGIFNRRYLFTRAEQFFHPSSARPQELAIAMIDLDHFKQINDQYGHAVGDLVLQMTVQRISANLRASDLLGRYGGEEFAVIMPRTSLAQARQIAERLQQQVSAQPMQIGGNDLPVTISVGVAALDSTIEKVEMLLDRADQALYAAKRQGRNRVVVWTPVNSEQ